MTETVDGIRDPQRVSPDADRAYFVYSTDYSQEEHEAVVDDDGYVRYPEDHRWAGKPVAWGGTRITRTE